MSIRKCPATLSSAHRGRVRLGHLWPWLALLSACGDCGACGDGADAPAQQAAPLAKESPPAAEDSEPAPPSVWRDVRLDDKVPICVFGNYPDFHQSHYPDDVRPSEIKAGEVAHFGAWPGWCINGACDDRPSMQCNVERDGQTLVVHTSYWGKHRDAPDCGGDTCKSIYAGCETPKLEAGTYIVRYGDLSFSLEVPSKPGDPCFGMRDEVHLGPDSF